MDQIELHFLHSLLAYFCYISGLAHISTLQRFCDRLIWRFPSSYLMCKSWIYVEALCSRISPVSTWRTYIQCFVKKKSDKSTLIRCYNIKTEFPKSTWQFSKSNDSPRIKCVFKFVFCIFIFHHEGITTAGSFVVLTVAERVAFIIFQFISWSSSINYSHSQLTGSASSKKIRLDWNNFIGFKIDLTESPPGFWIQDTSFLWIKNCVFDMRLIFGPKIWPVSIPLLLEIFQELIELNFVLSFEVQL